MEPAISITRQGIGAPEFALKEVIFLIEEAPEGGYSARALGHSIFTEAGCMDALRGQIRDAVRCHFDDSKSPKVIRLHFVHEEIIAA